VLQGAQRLEFAQTGQILCNSLKSRALCGLNARVTPDLNSEWRTLFGCRDASVTHRTQIGGNPISW